MLGLGDAGVCEIQHCGDDEDDADNHRYKPSAILLELIHLPPLSLTTVLFSSVNSFLIDLLSKI